MNTAIPAEVEEIAELGSDPCWFALKFPAGTAVIMMALAKTGGVVLSMLAP